MIDPRSTPEYRELLARVQYLNGVQARLGGLAEDLAGRPGSVDHATVAGWLYALLDTPPGRLLDTPPGRLLDTPPGRHLAAVPEEA